MFEQLESRSLFSVVLPALHAVAVKAVPAVHVAAKAPKLTAIQSLTGTGLTGEYFSDTNFQRAYVLRTDATVNLLPVKKDLATTTAYSVRWTGQISPTYTEAYSFSAIAGGGIRLWVDGQLMIDQAASAGGNLRSLNKINLIAGQKYSITLEYTRRSAAGTSVKLMWASLHQKQGLIPQKAMFPDATASFPAVTGGLIGQYYLGKDFSQLVMQRVDPTIDFNFGKTTPSALIPANSSFSIRWTGQVVPAYSETYTFSTTSDDGVRLYVDDQLIIDDFTVHSAKVDTASITLVAGQKYDIRMDYFQNHVVAIAQLRWSSPSQVLQIVPATALSSTPVATAGTLLATATDSDSIHLSWTGSAAAAGYLVQQSVDNGITYQTIATTPANVTQYDVVNLDPATAYLFRIAPIGSSDTSTPSNPITTSTTTDSPTAVAATSTSSTTATVTWDNVQGESGYAIYQASPSATPATQTAGVQTRSLVASSVTNTTPTFVQIGTVAADVTSFNVTGLSPGAQYQFVVRALNATGALSSLSNVAAATTPAVAPGAVSNATPSTNAIVLNWANVAGNNGYAVDRSLTGVDGWVEIGDTAQDITTFTDGTPLPGTAYYYRIRSVNAGGSSNPSTILAAVTAVPAPTGVTTSSTTALGTLLSWADVAGENGFLILESANGGNTFSQVGITPAGVTSFPVTGLTAGTPYQFEIQALNAAAAPSAPSGATSVITTTIAPASLIATALSATQANLVWTDVPGENGFAVQRSPDGVSGWSTIATLPATTLNYSDTTLTAGTSYFYRVSAMNSGGNSPPSVTASALTIPAIPVAALTGLSVSQSQVSWPVMSGVSQYTVQRSADGSSNWTTVASSAGSSLSAVVSNLTPSTVYYYRVIASNATGQSAPSAVVSQMTAPSSSYAVDSSIYGATSDANIFSLNMTQGTSTLVGQLLPGAYCANRCPANGLVYYFVGSNSTPTAYSWNPTTGNNVLTANDSFGGTPNRTAWDSNSAAWVTDTAGDLYKIIVSPHSVTKIGNLTTLAGTALAQGPGNMAFSPQGTLYLLNSGQLYTVNTTTAVVTPVGTIGFAATNFVFGQSGLIYATTPAGQEISVNPNSLVSSIVSSTTVPVFTSLTAMPNFIDLGVSSTASANAFTTGVPASYAISVTNGGPNAADTISVNVNLGVGATFSSIAGTGWTALPGTVGTTGQTVILTYNGVVGANGYAATATLNITITSSAHAAVVSTFSVADDQFDTSVTNTYAAVSTAVI